MDCLQHVQVSERDFEYYVLYNLKLQSTVFKVEHKICLMSRPTLEPNRIICICIFRIVFNCALFFKNVFRVVADDVYVHFSSR